MLILTDEIKQIFKTAFDNFIKSGQSINTAHLHALLYPDFTTHPTQVRRRVLAAGLVANRVRHLMTDKDSIAAVDAAIAFGLGKIGLDELNRAAAAAYEAAYYAPVTEVDAAYAAAFAANAAAAPDAAAAAYEAVAKVQKR
jgi:hypothetical protein